MNIGQAHEMLDREYAAAKEKEWVEKPLAYAVYQVWKAADRANDKREESKK